MALNANQADLEAYLKVAGLLSLDVNIDLGALLGGGDSSQSLPKDVTHHYRTLCGKSFKNHPGGTSATASGAQDCLAQCERSAIQLTASVGSLVDCLGVTLQNGLEVNNCLFFTGSDSDILDANVDALNSDPDSDSFAR